MEFTNDQIKKIKLLDSPFERMYEAEFLVPKYHSHDDECWDLIPENRREYAVKKQQVTFAAIHCIKCQTDVKVFYRYHLDARYLQERISERVFCPTCRGKLYW